MNYYSTILLFLFGLVSNSQTEHFVAFTEENVSVSSESQFVTITLPFKILEDYHIQSESKVLEDVIATEIIFDDSASFDIVSYEYTLKHNEKVVLNQYVHDVLTDEFEVTVRLKVNKNISDYKLNGQLYYQACTDRQCLFPRTLNFQVPIN